MKRKALLLFLFVFCGIFSIHAQTRQITGTVTSAEDGATLPGVAVVVRGTTVGTVTDFSGEYLLDVPSDAQVLVFTYIGMRTQEVQVEGRTTINVEMQPDLLEVDEVIVVGYGVTRRSTFTGSASTVSSQRLEQVPVTSFDKALQGNMPGVHITSASGQPGSSAQIRIRGIGSISAGTEPLYIVDGVPIATGDYSQQSSTTSALSHINPNDIESVTVLKDAAATAIYGSRASNGVVLIQTKRGAEGVTNFNFRSQAGFSSRTNEDYKVLSGDEFVMLTNEGRANAGLSPQDFEDYADFDWLDAAFRDNALTQSYELSANGGTEKTRFYISGSMYDQEGMAIGSSLERLSGRFNLDHEATDRLTFGVNLGLSRTYQDTPLTDAAYFTSPVTGSFLLPPVYSAYNEDGSYNMDYPALGGVNFVANLDYNDHDSWANRAVGSAYAEYDILDNLVFRSTFGLDWLDLLEEFWDDHRAKGNTAFEKGRASASIAKNTIWSTTNTLNFTETFDDVHNIALMVGQEAQASDYKDYYVASEDFPSFQLRRLVSGATPVTASGTGTSWRLTSWFSQLNYNMDNKYYLSASIRRDGSSRFGRENRYANFWSVGGSWRLSEEAFISDNFTFVDNFQLRASYGTSGNSQIGNFAALGLYGYGRDYDGRPGSSPAQFENPDLTWEQNINYNIGLDVRVFERVSATVEYYNRRTSDLLLNVPLSSTSGITTQLRNVGEMENKGWEVSLATDLLDPLSDFNWNIEGNISFNKNRIIKLVDGEDIVDGTKIRREDEPFQSFYLERWAGVNPANGMPLWYDEDGNITGSYTQASREIVGNADPDFFGGFTNTFRWRGFSVSAFFSFVYGNELFDDTNRIMGSDGAFAGFNQNRDQLNRWTEPGQITDTPKRIHGNPTSSNQRSTRNMFDGSYMRLKNLNVSYMLPSSIMNRIDVNSVRIYLQGQNLLTWTNYPGMDPEQQINGVVWFVYPNAKTMTVGLDISF